VLPHLEVVLLDALLRALDGAGHHAVLDGNVLLHAELFHEARDAVGAEDAQEVVLERQVEP